MDLEFEIYCFIPITYGLRGTRITNIILSSKCSIHYFHKLLERSYTQLRTEFDKQDPKQFYKFDIWVIRGRGLGT